MNVYTANVTWERQEENFTAGRYSRAHRWAFDGGLSVPASASPLHVPAGTADPAALDPEEAFVAALSSCHMLFFLFLAAREGLTVERYVDAAEGVLERNADGREAMTRVVLRPRVQYADAPDAAAEAALHHRAHEMCYLANSVTANVVVEPAR